MIGFNLKWVVLNFFRYTWNRNVNIYLRPILLYEVFWWLKFKSKKIPYNASNEHHHLAQLIEMFSILWLCDWNQISVHLLLLQCDFQTVWLDLLTHCISSVPSCVRPNVKSICLQSLEAWSYHIFLLYLTCSESRRCLHLNKEIALLYHDQILFDHLFLNFECIQSLIFSNTLK